MRKIRPNRFLNWSPVRNIWRDVCYNLCMKKSLRTLVEFGALAFLAGCVSQGKYDALQSEHDELLVLSGKQRQKLDAQDNMVRELENRLGKATTNKAELDRSLAETRQALADMARRKEEMEKELRDFRSLTTGLKSMIDTGSVTVRFVKGRMVVSLGSDVLFPSGSAKLSPEGVEAVKQVTQQLVRIQGKDIQIEGHTDNVRIKTAAFPSNWELASARALTVVNHIVAAGFPVDRVSAASYADTRPTGDNTTPEGKARNRRIDMVIVPDLSKLMDVDALDRNNPEVRDVAAEKSAAPASGDEEAPVGEE